ncbi:MAG: DNA-directed DNA polymerase II small subunit [Candidatus Heimdallarchaeota archaeon]|nr:DNA-directed DNA polymerase II small subunit [Candidatus Heimdallarchaeota archaeon]
MSKKRNLVEELLERHCLITPESYEILEDLDDDVLDVDRLAEALKDEIVVTPDKLQAALKSFEDILSEGEISPPTPDITVGVDKAPLASQELLPSDGTKPEAIKIDPSSIKSPKHSKPKVEEIFEDSKPKEFLPIGKQVSSQVRVLADSTARTTLDEDIFDNFSQFFHSRFKQMTRILRSRGDISGSITLASLDKARLEKNEEIALIAMVTEKRPLKNGTILLTLEDLTGRITGTISSKNQELILKTGSLLEDQVAGFFGYFYNDRFIIKDFILPDIPLRHNTKSVTDPISVCMTSDLHIGSAEFLEDAFNNLIDFLKGHIVDPYQKSLAQEIKYLIIAGDIVDGVGVYPKQQEDLVIDDIYEQYAHAAKLFKKIPKWVQIILISGNHDACRLALPQPAIPKKFAPELWEMPNVKILSNPTTIELHGKTFLIYHGNSFEDISSLTPGLNMNEPNGPMIQALRCRHLAPTFGRRSSLVPSKQDELVIEKVPDVFHTGHIHINSHTSYRGVECVNSGTFQSQTEYMETRNINPTPGRVPILNLQTNKLSQLVFYDE